MKTPPLYYRQKLPTLKDLRRDVRAGCWVLIADERLLLNAKVAEWGQQFTAVYAVAAGESLKDIENFARHVKEILPLVKGFSPQEIALVAFGGGSVGDFAGFLASVLKRGVRLVSVPTTWLAAVDSAHGGKTALNVGEFKNQVGTFYQAESIHCVKEVLELQSPENLQSAFGEVLKIGLLSGGALYKRIANLRSVDFASLWRILPDVIAAKYAIVKKDPFEANGIRHLLNLGHTVGHVYEVEQRMPHGFAVQVGLAFAAEWSRRRQVLPAKEYQVIKAMLAKNLSIAVQPLPAARFRLRLEQDKKAKAGDSMRFIFLKKAGRPLVEEVKIDDVVLAARELGWVL